MGTEVRIPDKIFFAFRSELTAVRPGTARLLRRGGPPQCQTQQQQQPILQQQPHPILQYSTVNTMKSTDTLQITCPGIFGWNPLESLKGGDIFVSDPPAMPWLQQNSALELYQKPAKKRVRFGDVRIRVYPVTVGDHPSCVTGVPVSLGWDYEQLPYVPVKYYERNRKRRKDFQMSSVRRHTILTNLGYSQDDMNSAVKEKSRIQKQRRSTTRLLPFYKFGEKYLNLKLMRW